jgi:rubrerythrin
MSDIFDTLKKLMGEELRHRIRLEEIRRMGASESLQLDDEATYGSGIDEITESLDVDELCDQWPIIGPEDSKRLILERVLHRKRCALRFYRSMKSYASGGDIQRLFDELMGDEERHIAWIEDELVRVEP